MVFVNKNYKVYDCQVSISSFLSYVVDWSTYLIILLAAANWELFAVTRYTDFSIDDITIMHFYKPENETYAPVWYLLILILVIPLIMVIVCCLWFLRHRSKKRMLWDIHAAILGSLGCCTTQLLLVVIVKNIAAVPRPDFLSRCQPDYLMIPLMGNLYTVDVCRNLDFPLIRDGFKSFPSGHSSTVFASQTFLVLFLIGKIKISGTSYFSWKLVLAIMYPLIISFKVSFSRVSDHRHRVRDVLMGDIIGVCFGFMFYFIYFSNPFGDSPSVAFPPRKFEVDENSDGLFGLKVTSYDIDNKEVAYTESVDDGNNAMFAKSFSPLAYSTVPAKFRQSFNNRQNRPSSNPIGNFFYL